ncbi:MAG: hypothetical protein IT462_01850 [Planctomycetes bacterium]|nr:hypothetical protein [Planctomycetota bacterium]
MNLRARTIGIVATLLLIGGIGACGPQPAGRAIIFYPHPQSSPMEGGLSAQGERFEPRHDPRQIGVYAVWPPKETIVNGKYVDKWLSFAPESGEPFQGDFDLHADILCFRPNKPLEFGKRYRAVLKWPSGEVFEAFYTVPATWTPPSN